MFMAVDRTSKCTCAELHERVTKCAAGNFLHRLIEGVLDKFRTVLTDNGTHLTTPGSVTWD